MAESVKLNVDVHRKAAAACQGMGATDAVVATVILPAYNEAAALPKVLSALLVVLDAALTRGGLSSWFNRMRASLSRARADAVSVAHSLEREYAEAVLRGGSVGGRCRFLPRATS